MSLKNYVLENLTLLGVGETTTLDIPHGKKGHIRATVHSCNGKFMTRIVGEQIHVTRLPENIQPQTLKERVMRTLEKVESGKWCHVEMPPQDVQKFRSLMPAGKFTTRYDNGTLMIRRKTGSLRKYVEAQIYGMKPGESREIDIKGVPYESFRASLPKGQFVTRTRKGKITVSKIVPMTDQEYMDKVAQLALQYSYFNVPPRGRGYKELIQEVAGLMGKRMDVDGFRVAVRGAVARMHAMRPGTTELFDKYDAQFIARELFRVDPEYKEFTAQTLSDGTVEVYRNDIQ